MVQVPRYNLLQKMVEAGMMSNIRKFQSQEELLKSLSCAIVDDIKKAIKTNGCATLLVSGGSTPKPLFQTLSKYDIEWNKVTISLVDERVVNPSCDDSNAKLVKENFLQNYAAKANFQALYNGSMNIDEALTHCNKLIHSFGSIDVIILGMGADAHTASLFPNNEKLSSAYDLNYQDPTITITPTTAPYERLSLTLNSIINAKNIYLHFEGEQKQKIFEKAIESNDIYTYPIAAVLQHSRNHIQVYTK
jgi:6-phosphogluconolactonase